MTTTARQNVVVFGPNLSGAAQRKAHLHAHVVGCADCKHFGPGRKFGGDMTEADEFKMEAATLDEIVHEVFSDFIDHNDREPLESYRSEIYFAPCVKLPQTAGGEVEPAKVGGTGPRYTEEQLEAGRAARMRGLTNAKVAEAAGVKSPNYFAKTLRATFPDLDACAAEAKAILKALDVIESGATAVAESAPEAPEAAKPAEKPLPTGKLHLFGPKAGTVTWNK